MNEPVVGTVPRWRGVTAAEAVLPGRVQESTSMASSPLEAVNTE